ncbi:MAG: type II CAAX endopeptidase family protein [Planctomycetota bacterium]
MTNEYSDDPYRPADPDADFPRSDFPEDGDAGREGSAASTTWISWVVVLAVIGVVFGLRATMAAPDPGQEPGGPSVILELQSKFLIGFMEIAKDAGGGPADVDWDSEFDGAMDPIAGQGSVFDRAGGIVLLAEIDGTGAARVELDRLREAIMERQRDQDLPPSDTETRIVAALETLYESGEPNENVDRLTDAQRELLADKLGWVGELALVPEGYDRAARESVLDPARLAAGVVFLGFFGFFGCAGAGFLGLIGLMIASSAGWTSRHFREAKLSSSLAMETFAVWMVLFIALQFLGSWIASAAGFSDAFAGLSAFFLSLLALRWPISRGASWADVRSDFGLHFGAHPLKEFGASFLGFCMMLPCLIVGIIGTVILASLMQLVQRAPEVLEPTEFASHPVVPAASEGSSVERIGLLLLAAVAAPIVEEIFFRGALYRHLRSASRATGVVGSILFSSVFGSFVFAIVHPQGLVAVPALMGIAVGITILREWRDTVVPGMIVHALWNGALISTLLLLL